MKTVPFTSQYCKELLTRGYNYFTIQNEQSKEGFFNPLAELTFEAVRNDPGNNKSVAIKDIMDKVPDANKYSIMIQD
jgi:hypothetical protein